MNRRSAFSFCLAAALALPFAAAAAALTPHPVALDDGRSFSLDLPADLEIVPVVQGLKRVRFFARSPDGRLFVTDLHDLSDNKLGRVYALDGWDEKRERYAQVSVYLDKQRNPNSVAFHTDARGQQWLYVANTDKLLRYRYRNGDVKPSSEPETLATFPDYGLSYKYGGWHLTRSLAFGGGKLYVAVGSSCNACVEKEEVRAAILQMNPDGSGQRTYARGLRNAVGLLYRDGQLYATNQGSDHLGDDKPDETMFAVKDGADYGWPYCYFSRGKVLADPKFPRKQGCATVPKTFAYFPSHASALGLTWFPASDGGQLRDEFAVALHGSSKLKLGHGYRIVRVGADGRARGDLVAGFLQDGKSVGRPCDVLALGRDSFLFTDDKSGVIYKVRPKR
ncbi:PQQ-dependent sugar dehydrogenase [Lysobacter enzymogenes]|uniref:PQQ-dependent sugar dehydrogenase n=1 Tax=Lysobacter enzymogenes TaxID=69 RepID=UPI001AF7AE61|nr:PQQ-dependent sugar dehydrogenase [Lysobacter enzymogenes]QQQ02986.1 PQQ-dependent sugar dehydrogenase [Lysobacter enzymogenes]